MSESINRDTTSNLSHDIQIQIHSDPIEVTPTVSDLFMPNIYPSASQTTANQRNGDQSTLNLSSFINEARQNWGLQNVIQGVRPLTQNTYVNNFRTWMPRSSTFRYIPLINDDRRENRPTIARVNPELNIVQNSNRSNNTITVDEIRDYQNPPTTATFNRPLQERVAALQRNDPPDIPLNDQEGNEVLAMPETRQAINMLLRYMPIICIIVAKSTYDHIKGITDLVILGTFFLHMNSILREQVTKQLQRQYLILIQYIIYIFLLLWARYYFIDSNTFYGLLLIRSDFSLIKPISLSHLLFTIAVTDLLLKLITIMVKMYITIIPHNLIKYKGRGRIYAFSEAVSQLYRSLVPIQSWFTFLLDSYNGMEKFLGVTFSAIYFVSKCFDILERSKFCKKTFMNLLKKVSYGKQPTKEEIQICGEQCPICHDNFDTPVMLECSHIFCELCVGTWFSNEQTCPLCRSKVADDPKWQDGATTFFVQLY